MLKGAAAQGAAVFQEFGWVVRPASVPASGWAQAIDYHAPSTQLSEHSFA
jgi:hypothetical protein